MWLRMTQELKTYSRAMNALLGRKYMISVVAYEAVLILLSVLFAVIFAIGTLTETADDFGLVAATMSIMGSFSQITFVSFAAQIYPVMFMPSGKADAINDEATRKAFGGCSTVRGIADLMPVDRTLLVKGFRRRMFVSAYALCASVICSGVFSVIGGCFGKESTFFVLCVSAGVIWTDAAMLMNISRKSVNILTLAVYVPMLIAVTVTSLGSIVMEENLIAKLPLIDSGIPAVITGIALTAFEIWLFNSYMPKKAVNAARNGEPNRGV